MCARLYPPTTTAKLFPRKKAQTLTASIGRVHAPEADMRAQLPHRNLLFKSLAKPCHRPKPHMHRPNIFHTACLQARTQNFEAYRQTLRRTLDPSTPHLLRGVAIGGIQSICNDSKQVDTVMAILDQEGVLNLLDDDTTSIILDQIIRGQIRQHQHTQAFRGELLSRGMNLRLRRGTYTQLIELAGLEYGLGLLHRALAVGITPNRHMWHAVLDLCLRHNDVDRARGVVHQLGQTGGNSRTAEILLRHSGEEGVQALVKSVHIRDATMGALFISELLRRDQVGKSFDVLDAMFATSVTPARHSLAQIVTHCITHGHREAALRAWREMRRAWFGNPDAKVTQALQRMRHRTE